MLSDVGTGRLVGLQADVVWVHPTWGELAADDAWSAAGRAGLHGVLRRWLLEQACRDAASWPGTVVIGVRLPVGLVAAGTLTDDVADALAVGGLPPERLVLCVSEQLLQHEPASVLPALREVHATGVLLALSDHSPGTSPRQLIAEVGVGTAVADVRTPGAPAGVAALGLAAVSGPLLTGGLTSAEAASLLGRQHA